MRWNNITTLTDLEAATGTGTYLGTSRHTDAQNIRRHFGIGKFDASAFEYPSVIPGVLMHARDNSAFSPAGAPTR